MIIIKKGGNSIMEPKKLFRSNTNKMICGVCGGVAEYINIDPTVVRLLWVIFGVFGVGFLVYILAAIIMPVK
jgi:phage shock protein C